MVHSVSNSNSSKSSNYIHSDGFELIFKDELKEEVLKHRDNSKFSLRMGLSLGITGGSLVIASMYVTGIIAAGLLSGGIALGVLAAIFLLLALVEYVRSRKNN